MPVVAEEVDEVRCVAAEEALPVDEVLLEAAASVVEGEEEDSGGADGRQLLRLAILSYYGVWELGLCLNLSLLKFLCSLGNLLLSTPELG